MTDPPEKLTPPLNLPRALLSPSFFLGTGAGVGLFGIAPGTVGCLWGIPLSLAINGVSGWYWQLLVILLLLAAGIPICSAAARRLGRKDPGAVVWDEISSLPIVFFLVPLASMNFVVLATGFTLHRIFDISKPPPCKYLERLPEGWGIMADDVVAAIYAALCLHGILATGWMA